MITERITVKEIARLAGVSIGTVDRVLHNRGGVSLETKERIDTIIASLGYKPDMLARQLSLNKDYSLRVLMPRADQDSGYWALCLDGIRQAELDLARYRANVRVDEFDRYDSGAYSALLKEVEVDPGDGLLFAPVLPELLLPSLLRLGAAGEAGRPRVPYAFFDDSVEGSSPVAAIVQDPFRGGYLAARLLSLLARPEGRLVALSAHAGDRHIARRIEGFEAYFSEGGRQARAIEAYECRDLESPEARESLLSGLFGSRPDIAGVLVANSSGHLVGDWLARRGLKEGRALVSWDLVPANVRALGEDRIDCLVSQRPSEQAREALLRLFRSVLDGSPAAESPAAIPLDVYFRENIPLGAEAGGGS
jgi:Transcriptional regulators